MSFLIFNHFPPLSDIFEQTRPGYYGETMPKRLADPASKKSSISNYVWIVKTTLRRPPVIFS